MKEIIVELDSVRLDKYLANILDYSREQIITMIKIGDITVNQLKVKPSYLVNQGDIINILNEPVSKEMIIEPEVMDLTIVYEDDDLLVVNKPSGMVVHPAAGNKSHTLVNGLLAYANNLSDINGEFRPGIVHRLDKDTSGLLIVAKNNKTHILLQDMLKERSIKRSYIALVHGNIENNQGTIKAPIDRDPQDRLKQTVKAGGKPAVTHFTVLTKTPDKTLIKCELETGRTHQIRVHLAYIGHPVVGDPVYSKQRVKTGRGQLLHAYQLIFNHPTTKELLKIRAELPKEFLEYLHEEGVSDFEY